MAASVVIVSLILFFPPTQNSQEPSLRTLFTIASSTYDIHSVVHEGRRHSDKSVLRVLPKGFQTIPNSYLDVTLTPQDGANLWISYQQLA